MSQNYIWNGWNYGSGYVHDSDCVYQSIHITFSISSHSVYMHPHLSARIYVLSQQKMNPRQNCSPSPNILKLAAWNSKKTYVRTYTETTDMGKYCMLHSYIHGHCVVTNKINNVLLVCSSLDVFLSYIPVC